MHAEMEHPEIPVFDESAIPELPGSEETEPVEMPVSKESVVHESPESHELRSGEESLALLRRMVGYMERMVSCMERAPWMVDPAEIPVIREPGVRERPARAEASQGETPEREERLLPTWILTDSMVHHLEKAIEAEQRVRGQAYGG